MIHNFEVQSIFTNKSNLSDDLNVIFNFNREELCLYQGLETETKKTITFFNENGKRYLETNKENLPPNSKQRCLIEPVKAEKSFESQSECEKTLRVAEEIIRDCFTALMPVEWFSVICENKDNKFNFPSHLPQDKRLIYIIKNKANERYLIGKTGMGLKKRCNSYFTEMDKFKEKRKDSGRQQFFRDFKANPTHFEVGILYVLDPYEDLNELEILFIDCKSSVLFLYNDRRGGGGGLCHAEENPLTYAIPRPEMGQLTPEKCYRYTKNEGQIRLNLTPSFDRKIQELRTQDPEKHQGFYYIIRHIKTGRTYVGTSGHPATRARQHGYKAEYGDLANEKYDLDQLTGKLHAAMGEDPEGFEVGLLPIYPAEKISPESAHQFVFLETIKKVEEFLMHAKRTFVEQGGFNCMAGGGPIASLPRQKTARRLNFKNKDVHERWCVE